MSEVRFTKRVTTLATMVDNPNGMRVEDALRKAEDNLDVIRPQLQEEVDGILADLLATLDGAKLRPEKAVLDGAYVHSNQVAGMAGTAGLAPLGDAAFSLCDLLDHLTVTGRWSADAVAVHLGAMRLLRKATEANEATAQVMKGLREVVSRAMA